MHHSRDLSAGRHVILLDGALIQSGGGAGFSLVVFYTARGKPVPKHSGFCSRQDRDGRPPPTGARPHGCCHRAKLVCRVDSVSQLERDPAIRLFVEAGSRAPLSRYFLFPAQSPFTVAGAVYVVTHTEVSAARTLARVSEREVARWIARESVKTRGRLRGHTIRLFHSNRPKLL